MEVARARCWQGLAALDLARHGFPGRGEGGGRAKSAWGGALSGSAPAPTLTPLAVPLCAWQKVPCVDRPGPGEMRTRHSYLMVRLPEQRCAALGLGGGRCGGAGCPRGGHRMAQWTTVTVFDCY